MSRPQEPIPTQPDADHAGDADASEQGPFFRRVDWLAFATTLLISLVAYTLTLSPSVTLEDSGELVVAADYLGVPHPPGYPIWTLLAWFFQWIFHFVTYQGQPNPAWAVGFMSACFGAGACALLALLVSRSGYDMLRGVDRLNALLGTTTERLLCWVGGVAGGLLFAFSSVQWSQAVIVEVYSLNAFFLTLILVLTYRWMCRPHEDKVLYATAFLFGLGLTNHQTLLFALPALLVAIAFRDPRLTRDCMAGGLWLIACLLCFKAGSLGAVEDLSATELAARGTRLNAAGVLLLLGWVFLLLDDDMPRRWIRPLDQWVIRGAAATGLCVLACYALAQAGIFGHLKFFAPGAALGAVESWFWTAWITLALTGAIVAARIYGTAPHARKQRVLHAALIGQAALGLLLLLVYYFGTRSLAGPETADAEPIGTGGVMLGYLLVAVAALGNAIAASQPTLLTQWKRFVVVVCLVVLGLSFYLYLPIASDQNPPMNWGYPRTEEGFWHALSRGQYERFSTLDNLKSVVTDPGNYLTMLGAVFFNPAAAMSLVAQFTPYLIPFALLGLGAFVLVRTRERTWMLISFITFVSMTIVFVIVQWPALDVQTLFIGRVQYIQAHAIYALWISYGLIFALALLDSWRPGSKAVQYLSIGFVFLLPLLLIHRNASDTEYLRVTGGAEQNGRYFGWQFGNYQLRGAEAILEELDPDEPPPPNPDYPPAMEPNAIFFGGTDPGRFVPTYMIYSAKVRPDVFLITQNALADNTYMAVMRDLYGDQIWIPSMEDSNRAFRRYLDDVKEGRIPPGASVTEQEGRVSVQGVAGVMVINGMLSRDIFDYNKHKHAFYVEESYVIPWMFPHLTPHGLIMKINHDPLPVLPEDVIRNDREFWTWYTERLLRDPKFQRDVLAQKTFSKLRSAIAGLYVYRRNYEEAELAFRQAVALYNLSPEANYRLADSHMQQREFDDAVEVIESFLRRDPANDKVALFLEQIKQTASQDQRRVELEARLAESAPLNEALELLGIYRNLGQPTSFDHLATRMIQDPRVPVAECLEVGRLSLQFRRFEIAVQAFTQATQREPDNPDHWIELAAAYLADSQDQACINAVQEAVARGGESARRTLRADPRFSRIRQAPAFQQLVPPPAAPASTPGVLNIPFGPQSGR